VGVLQLTKPKLQLQVHSPLCLANSIF